MDQRDTQAIDGLFDKLRQVERQAPARDAEADAYIRRQVEELPAAPYYMAQTILVQEQALANAQSRLQELEQRQTQRAAGGGSFLSGLFGGGTAPTSRPAPSAGPFGPQPGTYAQGHRAVPGYASPWSRPTGGGFLAGAVQTALGVAGGLLVADAITSAFDAGSAEAAELAGSPAEGQDAGAPEADAQDSGWGHQDEPAPEDYGSGDAGVDTEI